MKLSSRSLPIGTLALALLWLLLLAVALFWWRSAAKPISPELRSVLLPEARSLQPQSLFDQHRQPFSESQLRGKWTFLFFGYTYCPDICPTTLVTIKQAMSLLRSNPQDAANVQVVFVSVDPDRDSPDVLNKYMAYFDDSFIGVTGEKQQIDQLVAQARAVYVKEPGSTSAGYLISHSASLFLANPLGQLVAVFPPPLAAAKIAELFKELKGFY